MVSPFLAMCILFIARHQHPHYPLIIAANRDEYHARPSRPMHWWEDPPHLFAGRDLTAGGSWLGINTTGRFSAVTNLRSSTTQRPNARSRGELVVNSLTLAWDASHFHNFLQTHQQAYNPFNLVYGDEKNLLVWGYGDKAPRPLESGFHSISNSPLETVWPKMSRGVQEMSRYIQTNPTLETEALLPMMLDTTPTPDAQLPDSGLDQERERQLSPIFIQGAEYGTRTTTILLFRPNAVQVAEYLHGSKSPCLSARQYEFPNFRPRGP